MAAILRNLSFSVLWLEKICRNNFPAWRCYVYAANDIITGTPHVQNATPLENIFERFRPETVFQRNDNLPLLIIFAIQV